MANMEFWKSNLCNTSTMIVVNNNSDSAEFLIDKNITVPYETNGYTGSTTGAVISIEFSTPKVVSGMFIQNHNLRDFRVFYNSATASVVAIGTGNSATSTYVSFSSVTVNSIQLQHSSAMTGVERSIGELIVTEKLTRFERNPSIERFSPFFDRKQILHEMPDGGVVAYNIKDKYQAKLGWEFITSSFRNELLTIYQSAQPVIFLPEPTSTAWDGNAFEAIWTGDFDFKHSTNDKEQGYSGNIMLRQTPSR